VSRAILDSSVLIATDVSPLAGELASAPSASPSCSSASWSRPTTPARPASAGSAPPSAGSTPPDDDAVADSDAQLAARVTAIGRPPRARVMDLLIAATAHNAVVYTRNPEDLAGLDDVVTVTAV
jgi:toxin FitB